GREGGLPALHDVRAGGRGRDLLEQPGGLPGEADLGDRPLQDHPLPAAVQSHQPRRRGAGPQRPQPGDSEAEGRGLAGHPAADGAEGVCGVPREPGAVLPSSLQESNGQGAQQGLLSHYRCRRRVQPDGAADERDHQAARRRPGGGPQGPGAGRGAAGQGGPPQGDAGEGQRPAEAPGAGAQAEGGARRAQPGAAALQGGELPAGHELRPAERGEERGPDEEPGPAAGVGVGSVVPGSEAASLLLRAAPGAERRLSLSLLLACPSRREDRLPAAQPDEGRGRLQAGEEAHAEAEACHRPAAQPRGRVGDPAGEGPAPGQEQGAGEHPAGHPEGQLRAGQCLHPGPRGGADQDFGGAPRAGERHSRRAPGAAEDGGCAGQAGGGEGAAGAALHVPAERRAGLPGPHRGRAAADGGGGCGAGSGPPDSRGLPQAVLQEPAGQGRLPEAGPGTRGEVRRAAAAAVPERGAAAEHRSQAEAAVPGSVHA
ncbi:hypothetical protein lerEdw1_013779, partial [Lerista edwardsae]